MDGVVSEPIQHRVLVVGVGSIGERHLRCLQSTQRCELSFCETLGERRSAIADRYGIAQAFCSLDEALESAPFDAAVIATPAPTHVPFAIQLAEQGVHLMIEKPLSTSLDGVDDLVRVVRRQNVVAAVGYTQHAHPAIIQLRHLIAQGLVGDVRQIRVEIGQPLAVFRPAYADVYFASHEQGGGALQDFLTHWYSVGDALAGPVTRICSDAAHLGLERVDVEDTVHSLTRHGTAMGVYTCNLWQQPNDVVLTLCGDSGTVRVDYGQSRCSLMTEPDGEWQHFPVDVPDRDSIYIRQNSAFLDEIEGHGIAYCNLQAGIRTLRVNLASFTSARTGTWQEVES